MRFTRARRSSSCSRAPARKRPKLSGQCLDGVKIVEDGTWVLVLPDPSDPLFTVVAEAGDDVEAARLADEYVARIKALVDA